MKITIHPVNQYLSPILIGIGARFPIAIGRSDISVLPRKLSGVDPMAGKYPNESPYCYAGWNPVMFRDIWGLEKIEDPNGNTGNAGTGYKQTSDKKYLYGNGLITKVWNPNYQADVHYGQNGGGMVNEYKKGGYVNAQLLPMQFNPVAYEKSLKWSPSVAKGNYDLFGFELFNFQIKTGHTTNYNINKAVKTLNANAQPKSTGYCAKYVRKAIEAGGLSTSGRPVSAADYDNFLPKLKFKIVNSTNYTPKKGDIVVINRFGTHKHGHIQMYNGNQWVSDFKQRNFWPGSAYRNNKPSYIIFR